MSSELDDVARSLFNGQIPGIWRRLAPATLKSLGNWMIHFEGRFKQYSTWVSKCIIFLLHFSYLNDDIFSLGICYSECMFMYLIY